MEVGATRGVGDKKNFDFVSNTVAIMSDFGTGSGVVIQKWKDCYELSRGWDSKVVDVYFHDKNKDFEQLEFKKGDVIRVNGKNDLALIQVKSISKNIVPIEIAKSFPRVGEDAHAVGHPDNEFWTYTRGYVSQVRKKYEWNYDDEQYVSSVIQTQTPINPGNSGGPLVNSQGLLLGINSFMSRDNIGLNFAVSSVEINELLNLKTDIAIQRKELRFDVPVQVITKICGL